MGWFDSIWRRPDREATPSDVYVLDPSRPEFRAEIKKAILGSVIEIDDEDDARALRLVAQPWQLEALGYRVRLGEVRDAADFYARPLRRLRWYVGEIQDDGQIVETKDPIAKAAWARVRDPGGGNKGLVTQYGRLMFCTGEALLLYTPSHWVDERGEWVEDATGYDADLSESIDAVDETDPADVDPEAPDRRYTPESWEMLSTAELRPDASGLFMRFRAGGAMAAEALIPGSRVYRLWQRDTAYSELADAPLRSVLDLCEELAILTLVVRARAISRLAGNGILFIPTEITLATPPETTVGDENPQEDPMMRAIIKALLASIEDQGSGSAVAPLLVRGPAEAGQHIRHIKVRDADEAFPENALRDQTIGRLAIGLDMPPEYLTGTGDMNHWGSWQVEREGWRRAEPIARQFADDMTAAYLIPALLDEGIAKPERYVIAYDASEILTNPDRGADAKDAVELGAIGLKAYREAMGWKDEDAPTAEEIPIILQFLGKGATIKEVSPPSVSEGDGSDTVIGPPADDEPPDPDAPEPTASRNGSTLAALSGAADIAVMRHREAAGAKIRSAAGSCPDCVERIDGVPNSQVAAVLGMNDALDLVSMEPGALDRLVGTREPPLGAFVARQGYSDAAAEAIGRLVRHHAERTLFDADPAPFPTSALRAIINQG